MVNVSVVIATYNRANSLRDTLASFERLKNGKCSYEIIVVDNNSKDNTREVVKEFESRLSLTRPRCTSIKYVFEPRQGVAYARNAGIRAAKGEIIACTDDDVLVDPEWVSALWQCFQETGAEAVGGRISRLWNCPKPKWFSEEVGGCFISQELGEERQVWKSERIHMVTANFAIRKEAFDRLGLFREELGRRGDELLGGEDRDMYQRLVRGGAKIVYEPSALVHHKVEPQRLTQPFVRRWFWDVGKTLGHSVDWKSHYVLTIGPFWIWKDFVRSVRNYFFNRLSRKTDVSKRFASEIWVRHYGGMLRERFVHWLPLGLGRRWCAFKKRQGE